MNIYQNNTVTNLDTDNNTNKISFFLSKGGKTKKRKLKIKKNKTIYVGDMMVDKLTAKNANVEYIHALYGYSPNRINHKNTIHSFNELIKIR